MKILFVPVAALLLAWTLHGCQSSSSGPASFCDTACLKDSVKFQEADHPLHPSISVSMKNCEGDTLVWNHDAMGVNRKYAFSDLFGRPMRLNRAAVSCFIKDTSYAWLAFNDCNNEQGYLLKIPFSKAQALSRKKGAINSFDPKYAVTKELVAYTDGGNIFIEEMATGRQAMMTFGKETGIDYNDIHGTLDSVNITSARIWAKVKLDNKWEIKEKDITLK